MPTSPANVTFFETPTAFRRWLARHHATSRELWVGFFRKGSGRPSLTWPESVDEALRYGWIDGVRKSLDPLSYAIRFTPRRAGSTWSAVNVRRARALVSAGEMRAAGRKAFEARTEERTGAYSYEQRPAELPEPYLAILERDTAAFRSFQAKPPSYRKTVAWWIVSAKKEETRLRRLKKLVEFESRGLPLPEMAQRSSARPRVTSARASRPAG